MSPYDARPGWEVDLRTLLDARGERLRVLATLALPALSPEDAEPGPAEAAQVRAGEPDSERALADALVEAFSQRRPGGPTTTDVGPRGGVALRMDDDVEAIETAARRALMRRTTLEKRDAAQVLEAYCHLAPAEVAADLGVRERDVHRMLEDARAADVQGFDARSFELARLRTVADDVDERGFEERRFDERESPGLDRGSEATSPLGVGDVVARTRRRRRARILRGAVAGGLSVVVVAVGVAWGAGIGPWDDARPATTQAGHGATTGGATSGPAGTSPSSDPNYGLAASQLCDSFVASVSPGDGGSAPLTLSTTSSTIAPSSTWAAHIKTSPARLAQNHVVPTGAPVVAVLGGPGRDTVEAVGVGTIPTLDATTGHAAGDIAVHFPNCANQGPLSTGTYSVVAIQPAALTSSSSPALAVLASSRVTLKVVAKAPATDADGHRTADQPTWLRGTPVVCGMASDALQLLPGYLPNSLATSSSNLPPWIGMQVRNIANESLNIPTGAKMAVAWAEFGRVVSVGGNELAHGTTGKIAQSSTVPIKADLANTTNTCGAHTGDRYTTKLPPGTYTAIPFAEVGGPQASDHAVLGWFVGLPATVTIDAKGSVHIQSLAQGLAQSSSD